MRNPFRSESAAFSFLLVVIVGAALVVVASLLGGWWVGVPVAVVVTVGAILVYRRGDLGAARKASPRTSSSSPRR